MFDQTLQTSAKNPEKACAYVEWQIDTYVSQWKARKLASIRPEHCRDLHQKLGETSGQVTANRTLQLLRVLFNHARREGLFHSENPAVGVRPFREVSRQRFLQPDELRKLFQALNSSRSTPRDMRDLCLVLLFTGGRKSNVMSMRWDQVVVDSENPTWTIPDKSSKSGVSYTVALVPEVCAIIKKRRAIAADSPWIFPSITSASGHVEDVKKHWSDLLWRAKITDLHLHDLRRSLGSWQAGLGSSLLVIGKSLGHRSTQATEVYSRLSLDPVRESVAAAVSAMQLAGRAKTPAKKQLGR
jgi:integrase